MPAKIRHSTSYPGVYFILSQQSISSRKEKIYYIRYRKTKKQIEEKVGWQYRDNMTPAKASQIRMQRLDGKEDSNEEKRIQTLMKPPKQWTISALWEELKRRNQIVQTSIDEYRFAKHLDPVFGNMTVPDLTQCMIDDLRSSLEEDFKPATVHRILSELRRIINFGEKKQLSPRLSFIIQMPKVDNLKTEDLTSDQLKKLMKVLDEDQDQESANLFRLALFTGMRKSEMLKLEWRDIDFDKKFIHIRNPKGGKDQIIPLNSSAKAVLEKHPRSKSQFVFPGKNGGMRKDVRGPASRIKERANLPNDFRPLHGLRHVFASHLASSGKVDLYTLQRLLTHKSPEMTQRYAHLRDEALREASEIAGEIANEL